MSFIIIIFMATESSAARLKELASVKGVRNNQLVGYGLVVGLDGTGDGSKTPFTSQALANMLENMGVHVNKADLKVKIVAGVLVTTQLPPFAKIGQTIDVTLSSLGDASSLQGGTLVVTALKGLDDKIYAMAQGPISIGGFKTVGVTEGAAVQRNHVNVAKIPNGATVEREVKVSFSDKNDITLSLHNPDFTTISRMTTAINAKLSGPYAKATDGGTAVINVPKSYQGNEIGLIASLEKIEIIQDDRARVIIDERTGTIVMGANVNIKEIAIAHGNLNIEIGEQPYTQNTGTKDQNEEVNLIYMKNGVNLGEIVRAINAIGTTPRDLIAVFQAIKAAGALQADLEII